MGAGSADECSESYAHPEVSRGGKCARVKNWQKDAQPEWPEAESGARELSEAGRHADATEVLPPIRSFPPAGEPPVTASGSGWFGESGESPRGRGSSDADRTEVLGSRIGGRAPREQGPDPLVRRRITWGTTDPPGANPGNPAPNQGNAIPRAHSSGTAPQPLREPGNGHAPGFGPDFDRTAVLPPAGAGAPGPATRDARDSGPDFDRTAVLPPTGAGAPGPATRDARDSGPRSGHAPGPGAGFDRTAVLPPTGAGAFGEPTRAFPAPASGSVPVPPAAPATAALRDPWQESPDTDGDAGTAAGHTHDPHEVTVQLDAVHLGDGVLLRADGGHRKTRPEASDGPVFVDASGRRSRLYRRLGILVGVACAVYAVVIVSTLLSGNSDAPWMPVPGQEKGAPAGQVDTTPLPSQSAQPSGTGTAAPQATPSGDAGATADPGVEVPASGTSGTTGGGTGRPGTSTGPRSSAPGTDQNPGGGATGPDPTQSTQVPPPDTTGPSVPAGGGGTSADPTTPTGGSTTGTDPGAGGSNADGAAAPDPVAGQGGAPVVAAR
ncbi:hypothetical protein SVIOM342S_02164 [Streptomyces violaceorubidus]